METAIKKAIEGGYTTFTWQDVQDGDGADVLLDPLFWQALGKAEGWYKETISFKVKAKEYTVCNSDKPIKRGAHTVTRPRWKKNSRPWLSHQHDFIDHLASGGDADSFFKDLLKP